jgi:Uma2 family endonuclease
MSQAQAIPRLTPYEQLLALPENQVGEIIGGQLYVQQNRPTGLQIAAAGAINSILGLPFQREKTGPGGWWILTEPEIHFVRDTEVAVPDLAGWRRERMPTIPRDHRFEIVPDWVCEILSPSTAQKDRTLKLPLYARYGVAHAWLVDPLARTLEAFELRDGQWVLLGAIGEDAPVCFPPFAAITFSLADLWV